MPPGPWTAARALSLSTLRTCRDVADRVGFFDQGRIVEEGNPDTLFSAPSERRTREFLRSVLKDR